MGRAGRVGERRSEAKAAAAEHAGGGKAGHEGRSSGVEIAEDGIRTPAPQKADAVSFDTATQEGHGASGAGGTAGGNLGGEEAQVWGSRGGGAKESGDLGGRDIGPRQGGAQAISVNGGRRKGPSGAQGTPFFCVENVKETKLRSSKANRDK